MARRNPTVKTTDADASGTPWIPAELLVLQPADGDSPMMLVIRKPERGAASVLVGAPDADPAEQLVVRPADGDSPIMLVIRRPERGAASVLIHIKASGGIRTRTASMARRNPTVKTTDAGSLELDPIDAPEGHNVWLLGSPPDQVRCSSPHYHPVPTNFSARSPL